MEITSGGTAGPRLASAFDARDNNVYGSVYGETSPETLARTFLSHGWRARKSSWTGFEVEPEWACVELFQHEGRLMFAGFVDPARVDELAQILQRFGLHGSIELWNDDRAELLRELAY
jgi:hypothetical protein